MALGSVDEIHVLSPYLDVHVYKERPTEVVTHKVSRSGYNTRSRPTRSIKMDVITTEARTEQNAANFCTAVYGGSREGQLDYTAASVGQNGSRSHAKGAEDPSVFEPCVIL